MTYASRFKGDAGYILVSVLAIVALLSGLITSLLVLERASTDTVRLSSLRLRQEALAQSAVALAGYQLFVLERPPQSIDGQQLRLDTGVLTLRVTSDAGKVDLNGSGKELLAAAYRASGLTALRPEVFAARVIDWRASDKKPEGRETQATTSPPLGVRPLGTAFRNLDDLRSIPGLLPGDIERLRPFLTIFNPAGRLSVDFAPVSLLASVPGMTAATALEIARLRSSKTAKDRRAIENLLLVAGSVVNTSAPRTYRVVISISGNGASPAPDVTVVLAAHANPAAPFHVVSWD